MSFTHSWVRKVLRFLEKMKGAGDALTPCESRRVLVVDDEKAIAKLFSKIIEASVSGAEVETAFNGKDAVDKFKANRCSVVLMDLHMPVMDGHTAFEEIERYCKEQKWQMPAVVFCSGYVISEAVDKLVSRDPRHCVLTKPVRHDDLVATIEARLSADEDS